MVAIRTLDGGSCNIDADVLQAFRAGLRGTVIAPEAPDYEDARKIWNGMIDRRPALIVRCTGAADVAHAVRFARQRGLLISVRGGGHNIAGLAVAEGGMMIDCSPMRGVWVDARQQRARAQAGCLLGDVDRETQAHGLAAVLGFVSATGVAGLTVGGGFGYLTRRYGWTCDNVSAMDVVTAEGEQVRASASENPELFWALRGGGGNFGIVTSFEYVLHPVGPEILGGPIAWRGEDAGAVLEFFREYAAQAPRELTLVAVLRKAPPAPWLPKEVHGQNICAVFVCWSGTIAEGEAALAPLRRFGKPVADAIARRPYAQMQSLLDATQPKGRRYYWKSHYLAGIAPQAVPIAVERMNALTSPHSGFIFFQIGGALNELPDGHSPAGNRDATFALNIAAAWESPADDAANIRWARDGFEAMKPHATGGIYVNFQTEDEGRASIEAAYGKANLARLAELKSRFDPQTLFGHTKRVSA